MNSFWNFLKKNKLYAAINLTGLTVSMAFVLLLATYVQRQLSTDAFQQNADRIYVIATENNVLSGYWLDKHLKNNFPEIEKGCCVASLTDLSSKQAFEIDEQTVHATTSAADSTFFDIFSYKLIAGDRADWTVAPDRCMVSEAFALAHFAEKDPIGKVIYLGGNKELPFTICGVYKDFGNSIIKCPDVLLRGDVMPKYNPYHNEYMSNAGGGICFVMVHKGIDLQAKHDNLLGWMKENYWIYRGGMEKLRIIPLRDMYFLEDGRTDYTGTVLFGNKNFVKLLLAMCLLLLAFAVLNYINMTTALTGFRAKEMATRRLVGADKRSIVAKIIAESTIVCAISMLLAVVLAEAIAPLASRVLDYPVSVFSAISPLSILLVLVLIAVLGVVAGIVPAYLIQQTKPIDIVRGTLRRKTKTLYSKVIIVVQAMVAVVMLVSAIAMNLQIQHMLTADLGYNTKDILEVNNNFGHAGQLQPLLDRLKTIPCVENIGLGNGSPIGTTNNATIPMPNNQQLSFQQITGDDRYFQILGLRIKQDNHLQDNPYWLNEYAFKQLGIDETALEFVAEHKAWPIGGIYYDFKIRPLEADQSAALITNYGEFPENGFPWNIFVKTTGDQGTARKQVEAACKEIFPDALFEAKYLEEIIADGFSTESRLLKIVLIFTLLSMIVAALGLFAMSAYYMRQEIRTVSVKKVFGAEVSGVLSELVLEFMKMVCIAFVIGVPLAYYIMSSWLQTYSHRIGLLWWIFALAGLSVAAIAAISVLYQSIRTARTNPALALKKE